MHGVAAEGRDFEGLFRYLAHDVNSFPKDGYRMTFVENHDKNTWHGTPFQIFGESVEAWMAFTCVVNGMPLVYNGQEAGNQKQLKFFDKDIIEWKKHPFFDFYKTFFALKHRNQALWNGHWGGEMEKINSDAPNHIIAFAREKNGDKIIAVFNFSKQAVQTKLQSKYHTGNYKNIFTNEALELKGDDAFTLNPWSFVVLEKV
jgi:cyclomaltodextrinase